MINALFKHIYLLFTLQHNGKGLEMNTQGIIFIFLISLIPQALYIIQLPEHSLIGSIFFYTVFSGLIFKFGSTKSFVVSYMLIMGASYFMMAFCLFIFGNSYSLIFIIWQIMAILHFVDAIHKDKIEK